MYRVKVTATFSGAHFLRNYKGKCESLHGHNWRIEVTAASNILDTAGMVVDFGRLKKEVGMIIDDLDHKHLNDLDYFKEHNPSSEEIARYIYMRLVRRPRPQGVSIAEVTVYETDTSCASYVPEG